MSSTENAPINAAIQINWKTKRDGMLINIRANDATQLDVLLDAVTQRLATLIDLEKTTESMGAPAPSVNSITTQLGATPVASAQGYKPAGSTPDCSCGGGPMRAVPAGIAKATGRPYKGFYACPKPQGQACANKVTP